MAKLKSFFDQPKLINGKLCTIEYIKYLKFKVDYQHNILCKYTTLKNIKIGVDSETANNSQRLREDQKNNYIAGQKKGMTWLYYPILCQNVKGEKFLKLENWRDLITFENKYQFNGKDVKNIEQYHPMLLASEYKRYPGKNITEREKVYINIALDKIVYIKVNGIEYYQ